MVAMALPGARSLAELNRSFLHFGAPPVTAAARAQRVPAAVPHARSRDRFPCHCEERSDEAISVQVMRL